VFIRRDDGTPKSSEVKIRCSHSNSGSFIIRGSFIRGSFSQIHSNQGVHSKSDSVKGLCLLQDTAEIQPAVHTHDSSSCFTDTERDSNQFSHSQFKVHGPQSNTSSDTA